LTTSSPPSASSSRAEAPAAERPVLWLHSHFELPTGGTKFIYEVARRVAERRPLEMLVERASPLWRERYAEAGVPLHEIGGRTSTSMVYWGAFPAYLRRDERAIRAHAARSAALVSSFFPMPWLAGRVARRLGLRHVSLCFEPFPFFHDADVIGLYPAWKRALLAYLQRAYGPIDRGGIERADRLLTLNRATAEQVERVYGRAGAVPTYAGVDAEWFHPYSEEELRDLRERHGSGPLAIHSTDFSPIKRTDLALRAFAAAAVPRAKLLVTSTREDHGGLEEMRRLAAELGIGEQVEYLGFVSFADLPRLYSLSDALLQTGTAAGSGATTMSLPVKEALACGTPVVRSRATDEDVEDGVSGFLVDPHDFDGTGRRLAVLLTDRERGRQMGEAGRRRITELYRWDRVVDVVLDALR
jgi:glycosyltransferase involved in cell wall biosynthesis